ncbi:GNAT family acetyltransferase [Halalkalicoccus jeotgali B3]|uniref:GNAT family acetyltransferase n=1 Tax=Halalkalicoccus jeotgali (strain DSM 18796 / CECT 7217 / JCM 14584 / KCTC 4019 / B3) TaxID=795797 RepID=D8JBI8_HALJB|nr:GNAT family acetyltransferase [Halalkalicoccus jeotgali B3]ELY39095.1 GNAT family acetyltransferase [Halalkalicoccus jeotgali B3]
MTVSVESFPRDNLDEGVQLYRAVFNEPPWNDDWTDETARRRLSQILETSGYRGYGASVRGELVGLVMGNLEVMADRRVIEVEILGELIGIAWPFINCLQEADSVRPPASSGEHVPENGLHYSLYLHLPL